MANGYSVRNVVLGGGVSVAAAQTEAVITEPFNMSAADSLNFQFRVVNSAIVETTAILYKLQHSYTGEKWVDADELGSAVAQWALGGTLILADATIITADDDVVLASHGFETGDEIHYHCDGAGIATGLTNNTTYFAIEETSGKFQLALTRAGAMAGTAITLTQPSGGDGHFFTPTQQIGKLNIENSTDEPVLPLYPKCRIVANTGATDSFTTSAVYITRRY